MYQWPDVPKPVKKQIDVLAEMLNRELAPYLLGIYLHGSLAMGCFNPAGSDLDLLVLVGRTMPVAAKRRIIGNLLELSRQPCPIEISFLNKQDLTPWRHPAPFELHYSENWRKRFIRFMQDEELLLSGIFEPHGRLPVDHDLAAHITILHHSGLVLDGRPVAEVFPKIPEADYIDSILRDVCDAVENVQSHPVYTVLNCCRVLYFLRERRVSSKWEAGAWGVRVLPPPQAETARKAWRIYHGQHTDAPEFTPEELTGFTAIVLPEINALSWSKPKSAGGGYSMTDTT